MGRGYNGLAKSPVFLAGLLTGGMMLPALAQPVPAPAATPAPAAPAAAPTIVTVPSSVCAVNCTFTRRPNQPVGSTQGDLSFPNLRLIPGQPIEIRDPELATDHPAFPGQTRAPYRASGVALQTTTITDKLDLPWGLQFLPDGKFLVTEKTGALRIVGADGTISAPVSGVPAVYYSGQVGLLDVALDPKFRANHRIFFSFMEPVNDKDHGIAVARATLDEAGNSLSDVQVIFRALPAFAAGAANDGGRIAIAKNGTLFVTIGERGTGGQITNTDLGKIIHITADGKAAPGNPFIGKTGYLPEIWSIGHRSEEGLAFDARGRLWETEHGPRGGDELNLVQPAKNYGWPVITHGKDYSGALINGGKTEQEGMEQPRYYWDPVIAPSGLAFYDGKLFPQWKGSVLVGGMRGQMLDRLTLSKDDRIVDEEPLLIDLKKRIRDVRVGPDGAIYVITDDAKSASLIKVTPKN
jgi:glucose/arabinose dehydrogenase